MLTKIEIRNYRVFQSFGFEFRDGMNILVGDNDSGKSTVLEAVSLALTGRLGDRTLFSALSPHLFNQATADAYVQAIAKGDRPAPPEIVIDLFLSEDDETVGLLGTNNLLAENTPGLRIRASFDVRFADEYEAFIGGDDPVRLVPTEYYRVDWLGFSGNPITRRSVPVSMSRIDASSIRLQSGADYYLQQIIQDQLDPTERAELSRAYRSLREAFSENPAIETINEKLALAKEEITDRELSLSIDISQRTAWETSLIPHLDDLPFQFVGSGAQHMLKVLLALNRSADDANVILIEEPENHLGPSWLNGLVLKIAERCEGKQLLVTTHSSFVLNKLGLDQLLLLHGQKTMPLTSLPEDTLLYFKRLSGYDTLRLVLSSETILVEGPSDELVVQRAFLDTHGKLPMEAGVDVINVRGLSFKRFLDIARPLVKTVAVVADNDGRSVAEVEAGYAGYLDDEAAISVYVGDPDLGHTLEPQLLTANGLDRLNAILGKSYGSDDEMREYMKAHKTEVALAILESELPVTMPQYIVDAVGN
jgi:putative ATP-dependent endonuclease of OLD family